MSVDLQESLLSTGEELTEHCHSEGCAAADVQHIGEHCSYVKTEKGGHLITALPPGGVDLLCQ